MTKTLGILGGLGPAASVYFYQLITQHTEALCDQDHLDIVLISKASIPDRTEYILGISADSPLPAMTEGVKKLAEAGAQIIAVPCNTAHYFYDEIERISPVPVLNIVKETVSLAQSAGIRKLGIMLRIAESLDRSMSSCVQVINCDVLGDSVIMKTEVDGDASLEIKDALSASFDFRRIFKKNLEIL
jgi:aspartate racemase